MCYFVETVLFRVDPRKFARNASTQTEGGGVGLGQEVRIYS